MANIRLENKWIQAIICPKGAELQSLQHKNGLEYMWQADANYWPKHSPVLFPIVGSLINDTYIFKGKSYTLPRHGFARDQIFEAEKISDTEAVFTLTANEATFLIYPFSFIFRLRYILQEQTLSCTYEVMNIGQEDLWFSVGGHPAFAVPLVPGTEYHDYFLQFNNPELLMRYQLTNGLLLTKQSLVESEAGKLQLHPSLFATDAIVLKHLKSTQVTLKSNKHAHGLTFDFEGFPYLGIWAAPHAPFVCIEPWCGHADNVDHQQQLTKKEGIICLPVKDNFTRKWSVALF